MNEQNPQSTPSKAEKPEKASEKKPRYAAYDKAFLRFVGGVHDTQAAARKAARDKGVEAANIDVREV